MNLVPETERETEDLNKLWNILIGCVTDSKKLVPVGEYLPTKKNQASFYIEGQKERPAEGLDVDDHIAREDAKYYCSTCNKLMDLHPGEEIPMCCGRRMEIVD